MGSAQPLTRISAYRNWRSSASQANRNYIFGHTHPLGSFEDNQSLEGCDLTVTSLGLRVPISDSQIDGS